MRSKKTDSNHRPGQKKTKTKSGSVSAAPRIEPPPKKGTAQNLLYDLQQIAFVLIDKRDLSILRKPASMEEGVKVKGGASENYKLMGRFGSMVYYYLIGDHDNYQKFRQQTLNFIRDERIRGHMGGEQGCNQPHDGLHLSPVLLAHLHATLINDVELLQETGWWLGAYLAICHACKHPSYPRVAIPGFRIKDEPLSEVRDLIYQHCVEDKPVQDLPLPKGDKVKWQRFYLAVKLAIHIKSINAMPAKSNVIPRLYAPMKVNRTSKGLKINLDIPNGTPGKGQTVDFIEIDNGRLTFGRPDGVVIESGKGKPGKEQKEV